MSGEEIGNLKSTEVQIVVPPTVPVRLFVEHKYLSHAEIVHLIQQGYEDVLQEVLDGSLEQRLTLHRTSSHVHKGFNQVDDRKRSDRQPSS